MKENTRSALRGACCGEKFEFETVRKGYVGERQRSATVILRVNLPWKQMPNAKVDDKILVIILFCRGIKLTPDAAAGKAPQWGLNERPSRAVIHTVVFARNLQRTSMKKER
jgi:hypothetical protein